MVVVHPTPRTVTSSLLGEAMLRAGGTNQEKVLNEVLRGRW